MASERCYECSKSFDTNEDSYPFCSWDCAKDNAKSRHRRGVVGRPGGMNERTWRKVWSDAGLPGDPITGWL